VRIKDLRKCLSSIRTRWLLAGLWTALVCYLLLWPSAGTPVHDVSAFFGGTDLTDAAGHCLLAFVETLLLYGVLCHYWAARRALLWTLASALALGLALELAQNWTPTRGATLMDIGANWLGVGLSGLVSRIVFPLNLREP
jgi:VanZ family protein